MPLSCSLTTEAYASPLPAHVPTPPSSLYEVRSLPCLPPQITPLDLAQLTLPPFLRTHTGLKIPAIENLGATQDLNDLLDLTDNDIRSLSNFPLLKRLTTLYAANNLISRVDPRIAHALPYLHTLVLTNNPLEPTALADVAAALAKFPFLEHLALMGSPLARQKHYREYLIWRCKKLRVLDFRRVKQAVSSFGQQSGWP